MSVSRTVFLVDDDHLHTEMLKEHLDSKLNVNITTFSTGEDCLANLDKNPTVIILDFHLNSEKKEAMNGLQVLQKIKQLKPETEVIMFSGQDQIQVAIDTMRNGAFDYVIKGESAFLRAENVIMNIFKGMRLKEDLKLYKKASMILGIGIVVIIALAIILYIAGPGQDSNVGWM